MTINVLLETLLGKACLMEGEFGDATPFSSNSVNIAEKICDRLEKTGYNKFGWETLYNGFTGEPIEAKIYTGCNGRSNAKTLLVYVIYRQHIQIAGTSCYVFNTNLF
jgi:hypothetical protein